MAKRYELIVFDKFIYKGQRRHKTYKVGTALSVKSGFMLFIPPGLSVSGRIMMVLEKTPLNEVDLLEAYHSAADEYDA
jgi:hypothetical protein